MTTAVLQLHDEILKNQDDGVDSACVFLDCSAAFDTIKHHVLIGKMELYGVDEKGIKWIKDYLKDRAQYVSIGGTRSQIRKILDGTFQGSIGGPWCFLIMINDVARAFFEAPAVSQVCVELPEECLTPEDRRNYNAGHLHMSLWHERRGRWLGRVPSGEASLGRLQDRHLLSLCLHQLRRIFVWCCTR